MNSTVASPGYWWGGLTLSIAVTLSACGGGGGETIPAPVPVEIPTYNVSGTVSNLLVTGLTLRLNVGGKSEVVTLASDATSVSFSAKVPAVTDYSFTIEKQPPSFTQICEILGGTGSVGAANVSNIAINCHTATASVMTVAGGGAVGRTVAGHTDGQGVVATFDGPFGLAIDLVGNIYIADTSNHRIRKIDPKGNVTTLAGGGSSGGVAAGFANGQGTAAMFDTPTSIAVDSTGNVYVADYYNQLIRKIDHNGNVTTLAGGGGTGGIDPGHADGLGTAASFDGPSGLAVDSIGNVYVADYYNQLIRKIDLNGNVTTLAGGGKSGGIDSGYLNGQGTAATFDGPIGLAIDATGNLYVSDSLNSLIRKITADGAVTTLAGGGVGGSDSGHADGRGAAATFNGPAGLAVDVLGNVYVADSKNNLIRKVDASGNVRTLTGGSALAALRPTGAAIDAIGNLYIADGENNLIQVVTAQ